MSSFPKVLEQLACLGRWSRKDIALTVQQPFTKLPGAGVEPEHIGVAVAVEVPHPDDLPRGRV